MRHVALEIPLRLLEVGGLFQRHHPRTARVEVFHEPLDAAALSGGVAALEHDDVPGTRALAPVLQLEQLDL
jgi:hypothetical protein